MIGLLFQLRAWQWTRTCMQAATLLLLALALDPVSYGRYVTAVAIAACLAPLLVAGPAVVYMDSHRAFGSTKEQIAKVWTRTLLVFGVPCVVFVVACMAMIAGDWSGWALWAAVAISDIVLLGFSEMSACHEKSQGKHARMVFWQALPHALRLCAVLAVLAWGVDLTLEAWVGISLTLSVIAAWPAMRVPRKDAPRSLDAVRRLVRVGFRTGSGGVANRITADGDKPFVMRLLEPTMAGALFFAQRVLELVCFPLHASIGSALPRLLHAAPADRPALWRRALWMPALYAVVASVGLYALSRWLHAATSFDTAAAALAWLCWLPLLDLARGTLGNVAILNGRGDAFASGLWLGAMVRVAAALLLVHPFGWQGAVAGLVIADVVTVGYLIVSASRSVVSRHAPHAK
jgi:O-antigen/teichoic acid export membrane protein